MRKLLLAFALIPTMAWAQDEYGCTPRANTPQSVLDYFKKFNQPIPEQYCQSSRYTETPSEEPPTEAPIEEAPPTDEYEEEAPNDEFDVPPELKPTWPQDHYYRFDFLRGEFGVETPRFRFYFNGRKARR